MCYINNMPRNRVSKPKSKQPKKPSIEVLVNQSKEDLRKQQVMCKAMAEAMRSVAIELKLQVSGQSAIEGEGVSIIVLYSCFPNGDIIIWFQDRGIYTLMALVNQQFKHLATFPIAQAEEFQAVLVELKGLLGQ